MSFEYTKMLMSEKLQRNVFYKLSLESGNAERARGVGGGIHRISQLYDGHG
jgi:hypothetical protein